MTETEARDIQRTEYARASEEMSLREAQYFAAQAYLQRKTDSITVDWRSVTNLARLFGVVVKGR